MKDLLKFIGSNMNSVSLSHEEKIFMRKNILGALAESSTRKARLINEGSRQSKPRKSYKDFKMIFFKSKKPVNILIDNKDEESTTKK